MKKLLMAAVGLLALAGVSSTAHAVANLSFTTVTGSPITVQPGPVDIGAVNTSLTFTGAVIVGSINPADAANAILANIVSLSTPVTMNTLGVIALELGNLTTDVIVTVGKLTYTFDFGSSLSQVATGTPGSIGYSMTGTITGDLSAGATFLNQTASFSLTCTQTGSAASIGCGTSIDTPSSIPEPATLALLGAGLVGIGAIRRRRQV